MKEIIGWLLTIERLAAAYYREVSDTLKGEKVFSEYFRHLSDEENGHYKVMESALEYLQHHRLPPASITVDNDTKEKIETVFIRNRELLAAGDSSREKILNCLTSTELSEWNDIFIYVVNTLKEERQFMSAAAMMHQHLTSIENFVESLPEGAAYLKLFKNLPTVWKEQILIIDDDQPICDFLKKLLSHAGQIETACNGKEGLQKVGEKYYDVIISDVQMPVMDGIEFFRQAASRDPLLGQRIVFFTGSPKQEIIAFFREHDLRYLIKPAPIREIVRKVAEILPNADREP